jgi:hypothetical protein
MSRLRTIRTESPAPPSGNRREKTCITSKNPPEFRRSLTDRGKSRRTFPTIPPGSDPESSCFRGRVVMDPITSRHGSGAKQDGFSQYPSRIRSGVVMPLLKSRPGSGEHPHGFCENPSCFSGKPLLDRSACRPEFALIPPAGRRRCAVPIWMQWGYDGGAHPPRVPSSTPSPMTRAHGWFHTPECRRGRRTQRARRACSPTPASQKAALLGLQLSPIGPPFRSPPRSFRKTCASIAAGVLLAGNSIRL